VSVSHPAKVLFLSCHAAQHPQRTNLNLIGRSQGSGGDGRGGEKRGERRGGGEVMDPEPAARLPALTCQL